MTEYEKKIIFTVANGNLKNLPLIHTLHQSPNGLRLLEQCVSSRIIGDSFWKMWTDFENKRPFVIAYLMRKIDKDKNRKLQIKDL